MSLCWMVVDPPLSLWAVGDFLDPSLNLLNSS